ncbi:MAG: hemolysin family protein [Kiritimatiellia bacterium]
MLALQLIILLILVVLSAFFSSAEVALFSLNPHQVLEMEAKHAEAARRIRALLNRPTRLLSTILIGNTIVNTGLSIFAFALIEKAAPGHGAAIAIPAVTLLLLLFGEFLPKRTAMVMAPRIAHLFTLPLEIAAFALTPLRIGLEALTRLLRDRFRQLGNIFTKSEVQALVDAGQRSGALDEHEHALMRSVMRLEDLYVSRLMTPRVDIEGIDLSVTGLDIPAIVRKSRVRYLPLYHEQLDEIAGLLDVNAYLLDPRHGLKDNTRKPFYVPLQCTMDKLLTQFLADDRDVAVVVDEYGGTAGMITRGDVLEELAGDIVPDQGGKVQVFEQLTDRAWLVDAELSLDEAAHRTGLRFHSENADRLSGWFAEKAEKVPVVGDMVDGDGFQAMVRKMRRNRILLILIEKNGQVADAPAEPAPAEEPVE